MLRTRKLFFPFVLFLSLSTFAQINTSSPYSRFGLGDLTVDGVARNQMMGGLGVSSSSALFINQVNPALLARTNNVVFNFGLGSNSRILSTSNQRIGSSNINLQSINLAFPITKRWTSGIGLRPYSTVDYDISTTQELNDSTTVHQSYTGEGGLNQFYWSNGYKLGKSMYLGLQATYLFGNINKESVSQLQFQSSGLDNTKNVFADRTNMSDFIFKPAFALRREIKIARDTVQGRLAFVNPKYRSFKERLEECTENIENGKVGIKDPTRRAISDTLSKADRKRALKEDKKRIIAETAKNDKMRLSYCKDDIKRQDSIYKATHMDTTGGKSKLMRNSYYIGNKKFVKKDTIYIGNKLFTGATMKKAMKNAYEGKYLILLPGYRSVSVSRQIEDVKKALEIKRFVAGIMDKETGVIVKAEAGDVDLKAIGEDLDNLMKRWTSKENPGTDQRKYVAKHLKTGSGVFFNFGATYEFNADIKSSNLQVLERRLNDEEVINSDTLNLTDNGVVTLPSIIKFGLGLERPVPAGYDKSGNIRRAVWSLGLDFSYTQWSKYRSFVSDDRLNDSYRFVLGGEFIPNINSRKKSILPLMIYRAGVHYESTPLVVNGFGINDFGINFGVSIPVFNRYSSPRYLNLGFTAGQRGTTDNNLIRETYINTTLSVTINNRWFARYKEGL